MANIIPKSVKCIHSATKVCRFLLGFGRSREGSGLRAWGLSGVFVWGFFPSYLARTKPALQGLGFRGFRLGFSCWGAAGFDSHTRTKQARFRAS